MIRLFQRYAMRVAKNSSLVVDSPYMGSRLVFCPPSIGQQKYEPVLPSSSQSSCSRHHCPKAAPTLLQEEMILSPRILTGLSVVGMIIAPPISLQEGSVDVFQVPQKPAQHHGFQASLGLPPVPRCSKPVADATREHQHVRGLLLLSSRHNQAVVRAPSPSQVLASDPFIEALLSSSHNVHGAYEPIHLLRFQTAYPAVGEELVRKVERYSDITASYTILWRQVGATQELFDLLQDHKHLLQTMGLMWMWEKTEWIKRENCQTI